MLADALVPADRAQPHDQRHGLHHRRRTSGFPDANGHIPFECATIAEVLGERGWNTYIVGKWHLCAEDEMNMASSKRQLAARPRLRALLRLPRRRDQPVVSRTSSTTTTPSTSRSRPRRAITSPIDLTDKAIEFVQDAKAIAPDKPFFMYFCPGACHAPHHVPKEWIDKYKGKFDMGYEKYRELVFERQKKLGIIAEEAELSPINPYADTTSHDGKPWSQVDRVRPWDSLSDDEKRLFSRMAEVYAGFLSHADHEIGRLLDYLEDEPASSTTRSSCSSPTTAPAARAGRTARSTRTSSSTASPTRSRRTSSTSTSSGSPKTYNHYPTGWAWAFNTPFKMWKRYANYEGGIADPMIVSWPKGIEAKGEIRHQYNHAIDIVPTIYECLGVELPGRRQRLHAETARGRQLQAAFETPTRRDEGDAVLLDARHAGHLAQGLESRHRGAGRTGVVGRLPPAALGAVRHHDRPERVPRPRGRAPRSSCRS